jgi:hypothetical protein
MRKFIYTKDSDDTENDNKKIIINKKDFISHVIQYPKKLKLNKNLIIKENAPDFEYNFVKKYYQYISLRNKNLLLGQNYNIIKNNHTSQTRATTFSWRHLIGYSLSIVLFKV